MDLISEVATHFALPDQSDIEMLRTYTMPELVESDDIIFRYFRA